MARKNDSTLRKEFEEELVRQNGFDATSIEHSANGGYKLVNVAILFAAFKRAYRDAIKFHNRIKQVSPEKARRIIGKETIPGLYSFSTRPYHHNSLIKADTELARLAEATPGVKYAIFCLEKSEICELPEGETVREVIETPVPEPIKVQPPLEFNPKRCSYVKASLVQMYEDQLERE